MTDSSQLLKRLQDTMSDINFEDDESFFWSPGQQTVHYNSSQIIKNEGKWTLLHEVGHALLGHARYNTDMELLLLEVAAWQKAQVIGSDLGITVPEDHIQNCLDTYRDWLHRRSTCPRCGIRCLQISAQKYRCHNCYADWQVSASRFCRPYRLSKIKNPPVAKAKQADFA